MAIKELTTAQSRRPFQRRRKTCPFSGANAPKIDYKDVRLLQRYVSVWNLRDGTVDLRRALSP